MTAQSNLFFFNRNIPVCLPSSSWWWRWHRLFIYLLLGARDPSGVQLEFGFTPARFAFSTRTISSSFVPVTLRPWILSHFCSSSFFQLLKSSVLTRLFVSAIVFIHVLGDLYLPQPHFHDNSAQSPLCANYPGKGLFTVRVSLVGVTLSRWSQACASRFPVVSCVASRSSSSYRDIR